MGEEGDVRVLVVDDSKPMRAILASIVTKLGFSVVGEAVNGAEGVTKTLQGKPDIVLLDLNMPVKTGLEALREIRAGHSNAVVIMVTSVSDTESMERCIEAGATGYILKSTTHEEIAQAIKDTWETGRAWG